MWGWRKFQNKNIYTGWIMKEEKSSGETYQVLKPKSKSMNKHDNLATGDPVTQKQTQL